jgi:hypothetical protein
MAPNPLIFRNFAHFIFILLNGFLIPKNEHSNTRKNSSQKQ